MKKTPLIIFGALGRMGMAIQDLVDSFGCEIIAARVNSIKEAPFPIYKNLAELEPYLEKRPVLLDFSQAQAALEHLSFAAQYKLPLLLATTGHTQNIYKEAKEASKHCPIIIAPNTSVVANIFKALVKKAAEHMPKSSVRILDIHHAKKKDAPSGTALALQKTVADNAKALEDEVLIESMRAGDSRGEHTVYFFKNFERLELCHKVSDRRVFAEGALNAALFLAKAKPGLYDMNDVLDIK